MSIQDVKQWWLSLERFSQICLFFSLKLLHNFVLHVINCSYLVFVDDLMWTLSIKILYCLHQSRYCFRVKCEGTFLIFTLLSSNLLISTYLSHLELIIILYLHQILNMLCLFKIWILVLKVVWINEDESKHNKIMQ